MTWAHSVNATAGASSDAEGTLATLAHSQVVMRRDLADVRAHGVDRGERRAPMALCSSGSSVQPIGGMTAMTC